MEPHSTPCSELIDVANTVKRLEETQAKMVELISESVATQRILARVEDDQKVVNKSVNKLWSEVRDIRVDLARTAAETEGNASAIDRRGAFLQKLVPWILAGASAAAALHQTFMR